MEYITTKEASERWGISPTRITVLANEGRIAGAQRLGRRWLIPATATKPQELKPNHYHSAEKEARDDFSLPLYHFRPDWSYINEDKLTEQERQLLTAENAVMECRFDDAYKVIEEIMGEVDNIAVEIGCLWNAGVCCIALNKPKEFAKISLRLQMIMSEEIPHRDNYMIILDSLSTYTETLSDAANEYKYNTNIHNQCLPLASLLAGYSQLTKETMKTSSAELDLLELNLRFVESTGAIIVAEFLHLYMVGIYYLRSDLTNAEKHAKIAVKIAYENKYYFPLVTYYRFLVPILTPVIGEYPDEFRNTCSELVTKYNESINAFFASTGEYSAMASLKETDFPFIYAVLMDLSNDEIASRMNISPRTVKRRFDTIFKKLNVNSKKELKAFLKDNM